MAEIVCTDDFGCTLFFYGLKFFAVVVLHRNTTYFLCRFALEFTNRWIYNKYILFINTYYLYQLKKFSILSRRKII
jgi:hypothetical protein